MKSRPTHSHGWIVGIGGLALGITLMVLCLMLTTPAGWRRLAGEVGFTIRDEGTINGMWYAVLERPG